MSCHVMLCVSSISYYYLFYFFFISFFHHFYRYNRWLVGYIVIVDLFEIACVAQ